MSPTGGPPLASDVVIEEPSTLAQAVDPERSVAPAFESSGSAPTSAVRREAELVKRYRAFLENKGHQVKSYRIRPAGELRYLRNDLFDVSTAELCEAKGVTTRESIRHAIGQVLDYGRHVPAQSLAVLLPTRPTEDLIDLLVGIGIACVYEETPGHFRVEPNQSASL